MSVRLRDKLFPEGGKARNILRKINRILQGKKTEPTPYEIWMSLNDPSEEELELQRNAKFKINPKINNGIHSNI